jgi:hypothetical protein
MWYPYRDRVVDVFACNWRVGMHGYGVNGLVTGYNHGWVYGCDVLGTARL